MIDRATTVITRVTADRDAVAGHIDTANIDALLEQATGFVDQVQASSSSAESQPVRLLAAAIATAATARELIEAQLTYPGLPSQKTPASRKLAAAYERITRIGEEIDGTSDVDTDFFVTTAQSIYGEAFDLYSAGSFNQAAETGATAAHIATIAGVLDGSMNAFDRHNDHRGMPGIGRRHAKPLIHLHGGHNDHRCMPGIGRDVGRSFAREDDGDDSAPEPVTVPDPTF